MVSMNKLSRFLLINFVIQRLPKSGWCAFDEKLMLFRYCEKYYSPASEDARDIFLYLLRVYLRPPEGVKPMLTPALRLLNKHFNRIDTPKVYAPKPRACNALTIERLLSYCLLMCPYQSCILSLRMFCSKQVTIVRKRRF